MQKLTTAITLGVLGFGLAIAPPSLATEASRVERVSASDIATGNPLERGRQLYEAGRFAAAANAWENAAQGYETQGDRANQALSLSYLSLAHQELAQWEDAKDAIARSLNLLQNDSESIVLAQALNTQAQFLLATGQPQTALETWKRAQQRYEQAGDVSGALGSQINQAQALQSMGFYRRARNSLDSIAQQLDTMPDSALKASGFRSLGIALEAIGDLRTSWDMLKKSLTIDEAIGSKNDLSPTLLALGNVAQDYGATDAALDYFERAEQAALNPLERIEAQLNQFTLYVQVEQWSKAASLAAQLQRQLSELQPSRRTAYSTVNFANNLLAMNLQGQPIDRARLGELLANAVQQARAINDPRAEAYALNKWGALYLQNGQLNEAADLTEKSLAIAQTIQAADISAQSAWQLGRIQRQQGKKQPAIASYTQAVKALQSLRKDLVAIDRNIQFSFRESVEPIYRELVALLLDANPSQKNLAQARDLIEALQLAELDDFFRQACLDAQPRQIDQVDKNAAVIYPIILPDRIAVISSAPGQPIQYHATRISQAKAEKALRELLAALNPVSDNRERLRLSQQVYDWLIRPGETQGTFKETKTLVFVLDGLLRNIPMAALHDGEQYLIEKHGIALSPGLQLLEPRSLQREQLNAITAGISESRFGLSALPSVKSELKEIAELLPSSTLLNQEFTKAALAEQVANRPSNIIHLATHGQFSSRQEDTYLLTWEGRMNVRELSDLLQSREISQNAAIELLVLSACDTAAGDDRAVLGLAGFAVRSGARATVATLWPVKDRAAAKLVTEFYEALKQPGITKAEALRQAQLSLLNDESFSDPFFWSSFVIVGNWL
ncbi:CHAT domain-containing protein [Lusitaniella coriacea LEGE 07157]|uniref:CHAT domain-containing protein n=1 Tax=Lusitaniella coriacea LEGE 07157 TaxID=945747 RepID=A0A8J7DUW4_9CYAN|nr:CHAT domain-containing protein [Lusitaniella coriacea]MBE9114830.1 CHAT domain-containing protein [Lusitaniella coriacea LEGE 07157]